MKWLTKIEVNWFRTDSQYGQKEVSQINGSDSSKCGVFGHNSRLDVKGRIIEPSRSIPVVDGADVVVVGGGPARFAASTAAAREGCDVLLLERGYFIGGLFTGCDVTLFFIFTIFPPLSQG